MRISRGVGRPVDLGHMAMCQHAAWCLLGDRKWHWLKSVLEAHKF